MRRGDRRAPRGSMPRAPGPLGTLWLSASPQDFPRAATSCYHSLTICSSTCSRFIIAAVLPRAGIA
eukprot:3539646-Pyramimonas_sp.AAC.1